MNRIRISAVPIGEITHTAMDNTRVVPLTGDRMLDVPTLGGVIMDAYNEMVMMTEHIPGGPAFAFVLRVERINVPVAVINPDGTLNAGRN